MTPGTPKSDPPFGVAGKKGDFSGGGGPPFGVDDGEGWGGRGVAFWRGPALV